MRYQAETQHILIQNKTFASTCFDFVSSRIWAEDVFSRSRSFALCAALAILPFILIAGQAKQGALALISSIVLLPPMVGLVCPPKYALKIQFCTIIVLALTGIETNLGIGLSLTLMVIAAIDFIIFAPHNVIYSKALQGVAFTLVIGTALLVNHTSSTQPPLFFGAAYLAIIPLCVQLGFGLLKLRNLESIESEPLHNWLDDLALQSSKELALIIDRAGRVSSLGKNTFNVLATHQTTILGRGLFERLHPIDRPALLMACNPLSQVSEVNLRMRLGDVDAASLPLSYALFAARVVPIADNSDEFLVMLREIAAANFIQSPNENDEDPQIKAKLMSDISHDVRTPLNAIMGFAELLCDVNKQPKSPGAIAEYGQIIHHSSKDLLEVVTQLIDLTRLENGIFRIVPETITPNDVLDHVDTLIADKLDTKSLRASLSGALHSVDWTVDKRAARQVITTLSMALLEQCKSLNLKIDVSVVNSTLCFALSCPLDLQDATKNWVSKPITGLPILMEIARILARLMGGMAEIKQSVSGKYIAEVQFPLSGSATSQDETSLVQLSAFRDKRPKSPTPPSKLKEKKHA